MARFLGYKNAAGEVFLVEEGSSLQTNLDSGTVRIPQIDIEEDADNIKLKTTRGNLKNGGILETSNDSDQTYSGSNSWNNIIWGNSFPIDFQYFSHSTGSDEILLTKNGRYRVTYNIYCEPTSNNTTRRIIDNDVQRAPSGGAFSTLPKSETVAYYRGSSGHFRTSAGTSFTFLASSGDRLRVRSMTSSTNGTLSIKADKTNILVEYLGDES